MMLFLLLLIILLLILLLREHRNHKNIESNYQYINTQLMEMLNQDTHEDILLPTTIPVAKETMIHINDLLEQFRETQIQNHRSQKALLQIFTNISHDLRTPITVLKGYIEMLYLQSQKEKLPLNITQMIEKMNDNSNELVHSVNQFFQMAKIESGDLILNIQRTNLTQLCHETILEYYDLLMKKNFHVDIHIEDQPIYANVDYDALQRILKNLIDNSIKYGISGAYLAVSLYQKEHLVIIDIEDHGAGICEQEISQIFTRNYTIDHKNGNGLGLTISQELAKRMNGFISVQSIPKHKTIFTITLQC